MQAIMRARAIQCCKMSKTFSDIMRFVIELLTGYQPCIQTAQTSTRIGVIIFDMIICFVKNLNTCMFALHPPSTTPVDCSSAHLVGWWNACVGVRNVRENRATGLVAE